MIGKRVEIPAWSDWWMMGDRYGEVIRNARTTYAKSEPPVYWVKLDKSGKLISFSSDDLNQI